MKKIRGISIQVLSAAAGAFLFSGSSIDVWSIVGAVVGWLFAIAALAAYVTTKVVKEARNKQEAK